MNNKKKMVAMLLAGGQGSRLYALTTKIAKPAVSFGAKYRIIDFTLSNCINSNIDTVGVLTQYQPLLLNEYIGNGQPWDLDRTFGGVHVLPPYQAKEHTDWYKGTANAIFQNMSFINNYDTDYVLILSGDHIYKMDYSLMLDYHITKGADCTIAVIDVPLAEASRFGIMNTDQFGKIVEFEEKPKVPKSTKASMGIYIFNKEKLFKYLTEDEEDPKSQKDFGKNVIPTMLSKGENMFAYPFKGYWKDVGTIDSLWEANMDLIGDQPKFDIYDPFWKIHSRNMGINPQYIGNDALIQNSLIGGGCEISGTVINSVIGAKVRIAKGAIIRDSLVFAECSIEANARIEYSIIDEKVVIGQNTVVGQPKAEGVKLALIGRGVRIGCNNTVASGANIETNMEDYRGE